jgi:hypothetical protein
MHSIKAEIVAVSLTTVSSAPKTVSGSYLLDEIIAECSGGEKMLGAKDTKKCKLLVPATNVHQLLVYVLSPLEEIEIKIMNYMRYLVLIFRVGKCTNISA